MQVSRIANGIDIWVWLQGSGRCVTRGRVWPAPIDTALQGYGATPFPALSEAIEIEKDTALAEAEVARLVRVLGKLRDTLKA
jgi:hypothetical protein